MISSQLSHRVPEFDELINEEDPDFEHSGLDRSSVIRIGRLAVVGRNILLGAIGEIDKSRLTRIQNRLSDWIKGTNQSLSKKTT
jgi:mRNA interferase MazF